MARRKKRAQGRSSKADNEELVRVGVWAALAIIFIVFAILFLINKFGI